MTRAGRWLMTFACMAAVADASMAAPSATPAAQAYIEHYGIDFPLDNNEQEIIDLYTRILAATPHDNSQLRIFRDQRYGADARNRLDVHVTRQAAVAPRPVLIFFHGGGFVEGNTWVSREIYDNVGNYFARQGFVSIVATYRLAPASQWPSGIEDVTGAVRWAQEHASEYDGDQRRIYVMGHSAGAAHVADYIFQGANAATLPVAGAILLSGVYRATAGDSVYFGADPSRWAQESALDQVAGSRPVPIMVAFAEYDPPTMQAESMELVRRLCERDHACPTIKWVAGHNHMSLIFHVDSADDSIGADIAAFVRAHGR